MRRERKSAGFCAWACLVFVAACSNESPTTTQPGGGGSVVPPAAQPAAVPGQTAPGGAGSGAAPGMFGEPGAVPVTAGAGATNPLLPMAGSGSLPMAGAGDVPMGVAGAGDMPMMPSMPPPASGPEDGDPSTPVVSAPGVTCGPNPSLFGLTSTNVMIGGRGVHVAYPCNKHKGAPVVFVLNLHGTMPDETLKLYQVAYFSINAHADSHNIVTAAPKSVVSQWGNGDNGADLPHIMEVIDWVYTTFADLDIRAMWVAGHSWGAMYSTNFACSPELADKIKGAVLQSGTGMNPACADRISVISTAAENDIGPVINQGGVPSTHGCGAEQNGKVGNNDETHWPDCSPGFAHANYLMLGKGHADYMDAVVVERIADLIKDARP